MSELLSYSKKLIIEQSEELAIEEAKKDPRKFEPLYNRYFKKVFHLILNRVGDKEMAAELTSNVFFKALSNIQKFKFKGYSIYTWLFRIALNECNEHFRKTGESRLVVMDHSHYEILSEEIAIYGEEHKDLLKNALVKLKKEDLEIIELRFFESLQFNEIGEVLNISEGNSKVRLYRALDRLRKLMKVA
ncbi:MAG: sigma-70 family RNA polymerase sigma factor [Fulvivirga sp.]|uniref:RNA polymerase sigma factor n=1 Tax=Fulvivirga sp. TaxID=1931237 RepID=UPI0032EDCC6C